MGRPLTEHELVERARAGDAAAYATLVRDHEEIAFRIAYVICGNAADAEEAAQDAFVRIEGALVYARVFGDQAPYERVLGELVELLAP